MKDLTTDARKFLDDYLEKVRARLSGAKSLDAAEIERDIYEHIERDLEQASVPVDRGQVEHVLDRLGAPEQWVPDDELGWWRKIIVRMQNGPDDWRLAYICLGLFVLGLIILPIGILFLIPLSFYIARSSIALAGGIEKLQKQKVLIYPSLVFVYVLGGIIAFLWPILICLNLRDEYYWFVVAGLGLWWAILGSFFYAKRTLTDKLVYPFGPLVSKKALRRLIFCGVVTVIAGVPMGFLVLRWS
jgi:hypothetical protein